MKRIVVIFTFALLLMSAGKSEATGFGCGRGRWLEWKRSLRHPPFFAGWVHGRAWVPGFWKWDWRYHRYFWINGYWY